MQQEEQRDGQVPLGVVYTDTKGKVIFVNRHFVQMLKVGESGTTLGRPLWEALGVEKQAALHLLDVKRATDRRELIVEYIRPGGLPVYILCASEAAFDDAEAFIGVNISLEYLTDVQTPDAEFVCKVADPGVIAQAPEKETAQTTPHLLDEFFVAVMTSLQVLLARLAGPGIRGSLEALVDETAAVNGWAVRIQGSQIVITSADIGADVYEALLREALNYAVEVVGRRLVAHEMQNVYRRLPPPVLEIAAESGLRWTVDDRL
jgi:hypothetical protein